MRNILILTIALLFANITMSQTAVNFNCNDCAGQNHDLFDALDSGKVVVLCWVMPCGSCVGPSLTTSLVVESFDSTYPGRVVLYLVDDYANTSCNSVNSWANNNGIAYDALFSNSAIKMSDYGADGMPKIVVTGGAEHNVYYNAENTVNHTALKDSILAALNDYSTGIREKNESFEKYSLFPNPVNDVATLTFSIEKAADIEVRIYDTYGRALMHKSYIGLSKGKNSLTVDTADLPNGFYILELTDGVRRSDIRFSVSK